MSIKTLKKKYIVNSLNFLPALRQLFASLTGVKLLLSILKLAQVVSITACTHLELDIQTLDNTGNPTLVTQTLSLTHSKACSWGGNCSRPYKETTSYNLNHCGSLTTRTFKYLMCSFLIHYMLRRWKSVKWKISLSLQKKKWCPNGQLLKY